MCKEGEYSLVDPIFSAVTATLSPVGPPRQHFLYLNSHICYSSNKIKEFKQFTLV